MEIGYEYNFGNTILSVKGLGVAYGTNTILRNVDFIIQDIHRPSKIQGQVEALLAPSGFGKSQTLRCIAGLQTPTVGEILIGPQQVRVEAGMVGVVAQDYPLFVHLTVEDNLYLSAGIREKDKVKVEARITEMLEKFGLSERRKYYPKQLSGGQRQRVAIIQQILCDGHLLLMDEPFSGLDPLAKEVVQNLIANVAQMDDSSTIILTTHDIESAVAVSDIIRLLGRERDKAGNIIPGATILYTYNLMDMGLSWHPDISNLPQFGQLVKEIKGRFKEL